MVVFRCALCDSDTMDKPIVVYRQNFKLKLCKNCVEDWKENG